MKLRQVFRSPWLLDVVTWVVFAAGTLWRIGHVLFWHDPRKYVYSDMKMYVDLGRRVAREGYVLRQGDVTHPPGMTEMLKFFLRRGDDSFLQYTQFQLIITILVPLAVAAVGWAAFGKKTAKISLIITSCYYPFVDFAGYILSEIHLAFVFPVCIAAYIAAARVYERERNAKNIVLMVILATVAGFMFSIAMALKMVALPAILGFVGLHVVFTKLGTFKRRLVIGAICLAASFPITAATVVRCTNANGSFCFASNKQAADFLLGHQGRIGGIKWVDKKGGGVVAFGCPSAVQHNYDQVPEFHWDITDKAKNNAQAWKYIKEHPFDSLVLSFEHVWDTFGGAMPWPGIATSTWALTQAFQYLFLAFLFFPTLILLADVLRARGIVGLLQSREALVVSPIFGICVAQFIAIGEARYRIPWDAAFIVAAAEFYRRFELRMWPRPFTEPALGTFALAQTLPVETAPVSEIPPSERASETPPSETPVSEPSTSRSSAPEIPPSAAPSSEAPASEAPTSEVPASETPSSEPPSSAPPSSDKPPRLQ